MSAQHPAPALFYPHLSLWLCLIRTEKECTHVHLSKDTPFPYIQFSSALPVGANPVFQRLDCLVRFLKYDNVEYTLEDDKTVAIAIKIIKKFWMCFTFS